MDTDQMATLQKTDISCSAFNQRRYSCVTFHKLLYAAFSKHLSRNMRFPSMWYEQPAKP